MAWTSKKIACTSCGAPLEVYTPKAKRVVCSHCDAQLDLTTPDYAFIGKIERPDSNTILDVGMAGEDSAGLGWRVVGRLRFEGYDEGEPYFWDEFLVLNEEGESVWLQWELETGFTFFAPRRLASPVDPEGAGAFIEVDGEQHRIKERGVCTLIELEGEMTWKASKGDRFAWIDAGEVGVEWTERELELFDRKSATYEQIAQIFGLDPGALRRRGWGTQEGAELVKIFLIIGAILLFIAFLGVVSGTCSGNNGYRSSSSSGYSRGTSFGGGGSFGK